MTELARNLRDSRLDDQLRCGGNGLGQEFNARQSAGGVRSLCQGPGPRGMEAHPRMLRRVCFSMERAALQKLLDHV
jgi:hypothetical protein